MNFVDELRWRGMVHTMMPQQEELLEKGNGDSLPGY